MSECFLMLAVNLLSQSAHVLVLKLYAYTHADTSNAEKGITINNDAFVVCCTSVAGMKDRRDSWATCDRRTRNKHAATASPLNNANMDGVRLHMHSNSPIPKRPAVNRVHELLYMRLVAE